jgi:hypothetical protein
VLERPGAKVTWAGATDIDKLILNDPTFQDNLLSIFLK